METRIITRRYQIVLIGVFVGFVIGLGVYLEISLLFTPSSLTVLQHEDDFFKVNPECVDTPKFTGGVQSKICILPEEAFISASLKQDGAFEHDMVNSIVKAMTVFSDATLIDCGSNIGMVTTVVAAMGRKVVAIDPMKEHLSHLRKSLTLLGNENNVVLLNNAVSNQSSLLYPYTEDASNKAAIKMYTEEEIKQNNLTPNGPPVKVVTLMEVLATIDTPTVILKVDVESFECRAVSSEVAHGKSGHKIPFIIIEWTMLQVMPEYTSCVEWLFDGGYLPYRFDMTAPLTRVEVLALQPWWAGEPFAHDLIWLHKSADPEVLKP